MNYRDLGRTGLRVSVLGFGAMRLPLKDDKVDDAKAIPLLRRAVELGVNYFDSAVMYCNGDSQRALGDALHDLRDRLILSTKNHQYGDVDTWRRNLEDSLRLLRTGHIDVYHFHGMTWDKYQNLNEAVWEAVLQARDEGLIRHIAYSTHDAGRNNILLGETGRFESALMQFNLLDRRNEPALARLHALGMGTAIMGPVGGGRLANVAVEPAAAPHDGALNSAQLALKWVLSNPGVSIALSGMSDMRMLEDNVAVACSDLSLTGEDEAKVASAEARNEGLLEIYCTSCGYCMPCSAGVDIPGNFTLAHLDQVYGMSDLARKNYAALHGQAKFCLECGKCLDKCPQGLDIPEHMRRVVERLDKDLGRPAVQAYVEKTAPEDGGVRFDFSVAASNLSDSPASGQVSLDLAGETLMNKTVNLKPRMHRRFQISHLAEPKSVLGTVRYRAVFEGAVGAPETSGDYPLVFAHRMDPSMTPLPPDQIFVCGPEKLAEGDAALLPRHRFGFRMARCGEDLLVVAEVQEDHLHCADGLDLYLDCRKLEFMRQGQYSPGVAHIRLLIEPQPRVEVVDAREMDFSGARVSGQRHSGAYHLRAWLPLAGLSIPQGQNLVGFDIHQVSHGADGKRDLRLAWAGKPDNDRFTWFFGLMFIED